VMTNQHVMVSCAACVDLQLVFALVAASWSCMQQTHCMLAAAWYALHSEGSHYDLRFTIMAHPQAFISHSRPGLQLLPSGGYYSSQQPLSLAMFHPRRSRSALAPGAG
jgi:hypothetical protein